MDKLFIPVLQGTTRPKRRSIKAARLVLKVGEGIDEIKTQLVDPVDFNFPFDGNDPENKDPKYTEITQNADGFFIVTPEYNHSFPGSLKRMLDSELKNYIHKPVAFAGVSSGVFGGTRAIESLVQTVREMGMVPTFRDVNFRNVKDIFDEDGNLQDESYIKRIEDSYTELIWLAKVLKWGRNNLESKHH